MNRAVTIDKKNRLFNTQFLLLWQGQFVSRIGTYLFDIAMVLWIKEITNSASLMGLIIIAGNIPEILLAPVGGTLADIFSRRKILILSDLVSGILVTTLSLLLFLNVLPSFYIIVLLIFVSAGVGVCASCFNPAVNAFIPELVPDEKLQPANSMYQASMQGSMLIGQSGGGVLFGFFGAPMLFLVNGLSFLFSSVSETFINLPEKGSKSINRDRSLLENFKTDFKEGFIYCRNDKGLKSMIITIGIYHFFISPLIILLPFYVTDSLGMGREWVGFLLSSFGGGTLAGILFAGVVEFRGKRKENFIKTNLCFSSFLFIFTGLFLSPWAGMLFLFLTGFVIGNVVVNLKTAMQRTTPPEMRGRLFGFLDTMINASIPLGLGIYGIIIDILRNRLQDPDAAAPAVFIVNGICMLVLMLFILNNKDFISRLSSDGIINE